MSKALQDLINCAHANHITAAQIADRAGLDRKTVSSILSGESDNPKLQTLEAISAVLDAQIHFETRLGSYSRSTGDVAYYIKCIADKQQLIDLQTHALAEKDKWILRLFLVCLALIVVAIFMAAFAFS